MLRHHAVWRLAIYSFSVQIMENYQVKDHLTFQLKANGLDKKVVFSRRWVDVLGIMLDTYSII